MVGNKAKKAIAAALSGAMVLSAAAPAIAGTNLSENWYRIDGSHKVDYTLGVVGDGAGQITGTSTIDGVDRYDTMIDAIETNIENDEWFNTDFGEKKDTVVLVSGESYADTLAANAVAGIFGAPIITTPGNKLGLQAERAIKYFAANSEAEDKDGNPELNVIIVGGEAAVSKDVVDAIEDIDKDDHDTEISVVTDRVAGDNRMDTSTEVAKFVWDWVEKGNDVDNSIVVANGTAWADALSTSSYSYAMQSPLILTDASGTLSADQIDFLSDRLDEGVHVLVVGGPAKLAYDSLNALGKKAGGLTYICGDDRYDTSKLIVKQYENDDNLNMRAIAVATGENWPDALVGGAFVGAQKGTLVLVGESGKNWDAAVKEAVKVAHSQSGFQKPGFIMGGENAVSKSIANRIDKYLDVAD